MLLRSTLSAARICLLTANGPEAQAKRAIKARKNALAQHSWKESDQPVVRDMCASLWRVIVYWSRTRRCQSLHLSQETARVLCRSNGSRTNLRQLGVQHAGRRKCPRARGDAAGRAGVATVASEASRRHETHRHGEADHRGFIEAFWRRNFG